MAKSKKLEEKQEVLGEVVVEQATPIDETVSISVTSTIITEAQTLYAKPHPEAVATDRGWELNGEVLVAIRNLKNKIGA